MKRNKPKPLIFAALLAAACLLNAFPAFALEDAGTDYIIKYKESAGCESEDGLPFAVAPRAEALRLDRAGLLEWYEPDGEMELLGDVSPYYADDKWDLTLIQAEAAFESGYIGQGVRVGVLDSGVNAHALLKDCLLPGHNYIEDADPDDTADHYGHGTLVAALIAGSGSDGYIGAAPGAEIVPLKITDGKTVLVSAVVAAIYGAIDDYGCNVLNLSVGITREYEALREAVDYAEEKGVTIVAAVGNNGNTGIYYPAAYETVIGVGSVDRDGSHYYRSNSNESVFLTAPGVNVKTAGHLGGYITATGTSFAVPSVAAAAAVLLSIDGSLTPAEIRQVLADTATDKGKVGLDEDYGYGILNLSGCVDALGGEGETPDTPCAFTSPSTLRNYTDADIEATYLLATYDAAGSCLGVKCSRISLPAGRTVSVEAPEGGTRYGQFVYETATMTPLAAARKSLS